MSFRLCTNLARVGLIVAIIFTSQKISAQVNAASKLYTTTSDFNLGTLLNATSANNEVTISSVITTFNIMWIANAGEDTLPKVDTRTGRELARYKTYFTGTPGYPAHLGNPYLGAAPSRTTVDSDGNLFVGNRHFDGRAPVLLKVLSTGFIDRNGNGVADTSTDTNGDGKIQPGEMLPLIDTNGNGFIDQEEIVDEKVAWATSLTVILLTFIITLLLPMDSVRDEAATPIRF